MLIIEIALGLVLGAIILANLDSVLGIIFVLLGLAIFAALVAGAGSWLLDHPQDAALLGAIVFLIIAFVYWKNWIQWLHHRAFALGQSCRKLVKKIQTSGIRKVLFSTSTEREESRRKEMGYDE